jgi:hypothetical protein
MMETSVVHVHKAPYDVYVGRRGWGFISDSPFCKPRGMGHGQGREAAIIEFAIYWFRLDNQPLRKMARECLTGKTLACWCAPEWCHADIIAGYLNWKEKQKEGK